MDAVFERNLDQVSLILKDSAAVEADGFETKMACVGGVPGLLPMSVRQVNGETAYVYEVTARQPLSEYLKGRALSASELAEILKTVLGILEGLETYLLDPGHILFSADRIFAQGSFRELWLCYVPSHSRPMREGLYGLTMELLSNVDQKDRDAIVLGYRFAHELQEENTSFGDLRACLCGRYKEAEALPDDYGEKNQSDIFDFAPGSERYGSGDFARGNEWYGHEAFVQENEQKGSAGFAKGSEWKNPAGFAREPAQNGFGGFLREEAGQPYIDPDEGRIQSGFGELGSEKPDRRNRKEGDEENFVKVPVMRRRKSLSFHGLNRRTILIVVIGGAVLLAAYLVMHPEMAEALLTSLRANPLLTGGTLLAMAAAVGIILFVKKRAMAGETRAAAASSWALDESAWPAAKPDSKNPFDHPFHAASSARSDSAIDTRKTAFTKTRSFDDGVLTTCILAPEKKAAAAKLRPEGKAKALGEILLQKDSTIIGKQADLVDIVIPLPVISRIHARISRQGEAWYLTDLNSRNGTAVNNVPLESMKEEKIENGDTLRFANLEYVFESQEYGYGRNKGDEV